MCIVCACTCYSVRFSLFYLLNYSVRESRTGRNVTLEKWQNNILRCELCVCTCVCEETEYGRGKRQKEQRYKGERGQIDGMVAECIRLKVLQSELH